MELQAYLLKAMRDLAEQEQVLNELAHLIDDGQPITSVQLTPLIEVLSVNLVVQQNVLHMLAEFSR